MSENDHKLIEPTYQKQTLAEKFQSIQIIGHIDKVAFINDLPSSDAQYGKLILNKILQMNEWATSYLITPHEKLGRPGAVCPFAAQAIKNKVIFITYYLCHKNTTTSSIQDAMQQYKIYFQQLEALNSSRNKHHALLIVFVHVDNQIEQLNEIIEHTQKALKTSFIKEKLMIGQFYNGCQAKGIHNELFRPFDAPVPTLGIRKFLPQDLVFMTDDHEQMQLYIDEFKIKNKNSLMRLLQSTCLDKKILSHVDILLKSNVIR